MKKYSHSHSLIEPSSVLKVIVFTLFAFLVQLQRLEVWERVPHLHLLLRMEVSLEHLVLEASQEPRFLEVRLLNQFLEANLGQPASEASQLLDNRLLSLGRKKVQQPAREKQYLSQWQAQLRLENFLKGNSYIFGSDNCLLIKLMSN